MTSAKWRPFHIIRFTAINASGSLYRYWDTGTPISLPIKRVLDYVWIQQDIPNKKSWCYQSATKLWAYFSFKISLKFVTKARITKYSNIGSDNGLAPTRRQAIIWTNDGWFTDAYMRHLSSMS